MDFTRNCVFWFSLFYLISLSVCTDDTCQPLTSCSCEFSNGTGIDLTPAEKSTFYSAQNYKFNETGGQIELQTYYYHPCYDVAMPLPGNNTEFSSCTGPLSVSVFLSSWVMYFCLHLDKFHPSIYSLTLSIVKNLNTFFKYLFPKLV